MIDFSSVESVSIPEGSVTEIRDAAENTLWKKSDDVTMVTVVLSNSIQQSYQGVEVNGTTLTQAGQSASVPLGTVIQVRGGFGVWEIVDKETGTTVQVGSFVSEGDSVEYSMQYDIFVKFEGNGIVSIEKMD